MNIAQLRKLVNNTTLDPTVEVWVGVFNHDTDKSIFSTAVSATMEANVEKFGDDKPRFLIWD